MKRPGCKSAKFFSNFAMRLARCPDFALTAYITLGPAGKIGTMTTCV